MIKTSHASLASLICMVILTWYFSGIMDRYHDDRMVLQKRIWELESDCTSKFSNRVSYEVTVTTYNPTPSQTDSTPNETADGTIIKPWKATQYRYVALSRDLISTEIMS
jgi:hypothetical protein